MSSHTNMLLTALHQRIFVPHDSPEWRAILDGINRQWTPPNNRFVMADYYPPDINQYTDAPSHRSLPYPITTDMIHDGLLNIPSVSTAILTFLGESLAHAIGTTVSHYLVQTLWLEPEPYKDQQGVIATARIWTRERTYRF